MGEALWGYERVVKGIRRKIDDGTYPPGSQLPTRSDLEAEYDVSHMTVQRAITELKDEGLLYSRRGLGIYVREQA